MTRWLTVLVILLHLAFTTTTTFAAQTEPEITGLGAEVDFASQITFEVSVQPLEEISELLVVISSENQPAVWEKISLDQANEQGEIVQKVDVRNLSLLPFTQVTYHYEASLTSGKQIRSQEYSFSYDDDRFEWKELKSGIFQVYWYGTDAALGREIAGIAQLGLEKSQSVLLEDPPEPLRIYAYTSSRDLQSALQITGRPWVAGHATPELNMILISVPTGPEKKLELERQIPHEIMHILQYQVIKTNADQQPLWLIEGMASSAELYPNPEYSRLLESAVDDQQLIPFRELCVHFPQETAGAFQAYAQSDSFVRYIQRKYGASGLRELMAQYQNGVGCEEGLVSALDISLVELEKNWQNETLGFNQSSVVIGNLSPYLLLGLLILLPGAFALWPYRRDEADEEE